MLFEVYNATNFCVSSFDNFPQISSFVKMELLKITMFYYSEIGNHL